MSKHKEEISLWVKWLRTKFPLCKKTYVYLRPSVTNSKGQHCLGYFRETKKCFVIELADRDDWDAILDSLTEEWTHARLYPYMEHGIRFDLEYGHIRRAIRGIKSGE